MHCACRAASRAACTAGSSRAIKMPMIVITTRSSTSVNAVFILERPARGDDGGRTRSLAFDPCLLTGEEIGVK